MVAGGGRSTTLNECEVDEFLYGEGANPEVCPLLSAAAVVHATNSSSRKGKSPNISCTVPSRNETWLLFGRTRYPPYFNFCFSTAFYAVFAIPFILIPDPEEMHCSWHLLLYIVLQ